MTAITQDIFEIGKMPPQALEMEESVLGSLLLEDCINEVADILTVESFYKESHERIFKAIMTLHKSNNPVDILTVTSELRKTGELELVGGAYFISTLTNKIASSSNVEYYARIVQEKFIQRELIRISSETIKHAYNDASDVFDILDFAEKNITSVFKNLSVGKVKTIETLWKDTLVNNQNILKNNGVSGVPTGYSNLDRITGGWQEPNLIIIAARPGMGKTSLALNFARNATVTYNVPVLVFSLEMSALQIAQRAFSLESNTSNTYFTRKGLDKEQLIIVEKDCSKLISSPLFVDDTPGITLFELRSKARKLKREKGIKLIIVDYLQLMSGERTTKNNREQEISGISRGLKGLAKELQTPIIALSQLSRAVETRGGDKRPQLSDLRESGAIEQDADMVIFIHRPDYYGITQDEEGGDLNGIAEIIFSKHRNGGIGIERLRWIDYLTKFQSLDLPTEPHNPDQRLEPSKTFETEKDIPF